MKAAFFLLAALPLLAADPNAVLTYSKSFPGSVPAYVEIVVHRDGSGVYKEDPKDENPLKFVLTPAETDQMYQLADGLGHFANPLESPIKVANMGMKTFRYQAAGESREVKFNYSENVEARSLLDWFERIAESERILIELERAAKFDKLGVQNVLLQIGIAVDQKRLVAPAQFLPMLDRIAKNESYLHMSRLRAAALAESIRTPK